jgi:hypothetical protein
MSLVEDFKIAKKEKRAIFLKKYFPTEINWERILWFLYNQSLIDNIKLIEKDRDLASGVDVFGNVLLQRPLWMAPQTGMVWDENNFPEIKLFLEKLNSDFENSENFKNCNSYKHWDTRSCDCNSIWHSEGIKISLSNKFVGTHSDPWDACYFQIKGNSYWKITGYDSVEYKLEEGDILLFPKETSHEVWSDGPRMGLLLYSSSEKDVDYSY